MCLRRISASLLVAAVVASASTAMATNLGADSRHLAAGGTQISRCGSGFSIEYQVIRPEPIVHPDESVTQLPPRVSAVTVRNIPAACSSGILHLVAFSASGAKLDGTEGAGVVLDPGSSHTVPFSSEPLETDVAGTRFVILGGGG